VGPRNQRAYAARMSRVCVREYIICEYISIIIFTLIIIMYYTYMMRFHIDN